MQMVYCFYYVVEKRWWGIERIVHSVTIWIKKYYCYISQINERMK